MLKSIENFKKNVTAVHALINFDKEVQDFAIRGIEDLNTFLIHKGFDNPEWNGGKTLELLKSMRGSAALSERYSIIYNQAVVLLVSHFGSAVGGIFRSAAGKSIHDKDSPILKADLKMKVSEVLALRDSSDDQIGDLIIKKEGLTFQDMQSVHRAFKEYFRIIIEVNENVHNIITAQACRHVIVHDSGITNQRLINQLRNIKPRSLKENLQKNHEIKFSVNEINLIIKNMEKYLVNLVDNVNVQINSVRAD